MSQVCWIVFSECLNLVAEKENPYNGVMKNLYIYSVGVRQGVEKDNPQFITPGPRAISNLNIQPAIFVFDRRGVSSKPLTSRP